MPLPRRAWTAAAAAALLVVAPAPARGAVVLGEGSLAAAAPARAAAAAQWRWPLTGTPDVLRPFDAPAHRWSPGHRGVDLAAPAGAQVLAPSGGVVVFAGWVVDRPVLSLAVAGGLRVTLEPVVASVGLGTRVRAGDAVGALASDPAHCAGQPCLHWGVRAGRDTYLDPLVVLAGARPAPPVLLRLDIPVAAPVVAAGRRGPPLGATAR